MKESDIIKEKLIQKALKELDEDERQNRIASVKKRPPNERIIRSEIREKTLSEPQEIVVFVSEEKLLKLPEFTLKSRYLRGRELKPGEEVILQSKDGEIRAEVISSTHAGISKTQGEQTDIKVRLID